MTLRFSKEGPAFPSQLVDAMLSGEVVFLCGAGVSAPQLPLFGSLVEACFNDLNVQMDASECSAFADCRYEEVLGSLSRRIVDPSLMISTIVKRLQPPINMNLDNHRTILRLSRNLDNQPTIVTTNFDTLIERALLEKSDAENIRLLSSAGQDLPAPGSADFGGIIHLHGRIADDELKLDETALVVTSANYGDAYMRSGWASRFLFDLCRTKTIVLIGYSAGDAPFRYFLNVLEADRARFPDLRPVYALDAVNNRNDDDIRWSTLAVEPITYEYLETSENGLKSHLAMWRDLAELADVIERPNTTRREWARIILQKNYDQVTPEELDRMKWLLSGRRDLWSEVIETVVDSKWFSFFEQSELWQDDDAIWVTSAWLAKNLQSATSYKLAITWLSRHGLPFAHEIDRAIKEANDLPLLWKRAWRILANSASPYQADFDMTAYYLMEILKGPLILNMDIHKAVNLVTPHLKIAPTVNHIYEDEIPGAPQRLSDIAWIRFSNSDHYGVAELVDSLVEAPHPYSILVLATQSLNTVLQQAVDAELIAKDYDGANFTIPSIEAHEQNKHHEGLIFLVDLIARLLPKSTEVDPKRTRKLADSWRDLPGMLGLRLWLHALRNRELYSSTGAMKGLDTISRDAFWTVRREVAVVLLDRSSDADSSIIEKIEQRIIDEANKYYDKFHIEDGQVDWREHASDTAIWLRLQMLQMAGSISENGKVALDEIVKRRKHLDRNIVDQDYFGSYSYGVQPVIGDAQSIVDAPNEQRLEVAQNALSSQDIEKQEGWRTYCHADPTGAFDTLKTAPFDEPNTRLWRDFLNSLSSLNKELDERSQKLAVDSFRTLSASPDHFLAAIIRQVTDLYISARRQEIPNYEEWWTRLFMVSVNFEKKLADEDNDIYFEAINSPSGRLTEAALIDIQNTRKTNEIVPSWLLKAISMAAASPSRQGAMSRAALVHNISFVFSIQNDDLISTLKNALSADTTESFKLRKVLVGQGNITPKVSKAYSAPIKQGLKEFDGDEVAATAAAVNILSPVLSLIRNDLPSEAWGLNNDDAAHILQCCSAELRRGAADVLNHWITKIDGEPAETWKNEIGPLINIIWPRERIFRDSIISRHFANIAIKSEKAFPEAFEQLKPYLMRMETGGGLHAISQSNIADLFPEKTLSLLWHLFGPGCTGNLHGMTKILKRLVKANPDIETDRRFQWLDQNALR